MEISVMRERLHEAIDLAEDEKIIIVFKTTPLEISRSEQFTLEELRDIIEDAEEVVRKYPTEEELEEMFQQAHKAFLALLRARAGKRVMERDIK